MQECYDNNANGKKKIRSIKLIVGEMKKKKNLKKNKEGEVTLSWLCIGHTPITHLYLLKGEDQLMFFICQDALTVKHILTEYTYLAPERDKYCKENNIKKLRQGNQQINLTERSEYDI